MFKRVLVGTLVLILLAATLPTHAAASPLAQPSALSISPTSGPPGTLVRYTGTGFTPGGRVSVLLIRGLGLIVDEPTADPVGGISGSFRMPDPATTPELLFGTVDVFATDQATGRESPPTPFVLTRPVPTGTTWFFAEGATTPPFDTWFLVQNPGAEPALITVTFMLLDGSQVVRQFAVPPTSRFSIFANQILPNRAFSTRIDSNRPVFAERAMYVGFDGHVVTGIPSPARTWFFAEGATVSPFHTWLLLQNPNPAPASVTITYLLEDGSNRRQEVAMPPTSRQGIFVNAFLPNAAFAARVDANQPIIAERAMYRFPGNASTGVPGVLGASRTWFFAEGGTSVLGRPAHTWLLMQNPNPTSVTATVTLFGTDGAIRTFTRTLGPTSRDGVFLNLLAPPASFGIRVEASAPIIAERSMFFGTEPRGAHATVGSPELGSLWHLAEGSTAPPFTEVIALLNPTSATMRATIHFMLDNGQVVRRESTVGPNRKLTIVVDDIIPSAGVSARISTDVPTVVERSMYFTKLGQFGGHNTIGIR